MKGRGHNGFRQDRALFRTRARALLLSCAPALLLHQTNHVQLQHRHKGTRHKGTKTASNRMVASKPFVRGNFRVQYWECSKYHTQTTLSFPYIEFFSVIQTNSSSRKTYIVTSVLQTESSVLQRGSSVFVIFTYMESTLAFSDG